MAKKVILGTDIARDAFKTKANDNFTELYNKDASLGAQINDLDADVVAHKAESVSDASGVHGLKIESGTFTPTMKGTEVSNSNMYDIKEGRYYKIGNIVQFTIRLRLTSKDDEMVGEINIIGLPFSSLVETTVVVGRIDNINYPVDYTVAAYTNANSVRLRSNVSDGLSSPLTSYSIKSNSLIFISGQYIIG